MKTGFCMKSVRWLCAFALASTPWCAMARPDIHIERQMFVERVSTDVNGRARRILASPDRVDAGDQLIFVVNWRNQGAQPVRGLAVTNAIPPGMTLAEPHPTMQVSVDGGARWGRLDELWLPTPLGGVRRAGASDITHIRWIMPQEIAPGRSGRLSYRATVR